MSTAAAAEQAAAPAGASRPRLAVPPWAEKVVHPASSSSSRRCCRSCSTRAATLIGDCTLALAYVVMALGLNIIVGFAGLLDLGYVAFFAIGAYTMGWFGSGFFSQVNDERGHPRRRVRASRRTCRASTSTSSWSWSFAIVFTTIAGMIIGLPTLRLRGDYIAIVTLAFGEIIGRIAVNGDEIKLSSCRSSAARSELLRRRPDVTAGRQGITPVDKIDIPRRRPVHVARRSGRGTGPRSRSWRSCCS